MLSKFHLEPELTIGSLDEQDKAQHVAVRDAVLNAIFGCLRDLS